MSAEVGEALKAAQAWRPRPTAVEVLAGGKVETVKIAATGRRRWEALRRLLEATQWEKLTGRGEAGDFVGVYEATDAGLEEQGDDEELLVEESSTLALKVMRETMREARLQYADMMRHVTGMMAAQADAVSALVQTYRGALAAQAVAGAAGGEGADNDDHILKLVQLVMMAQQRRPMAAPPPKEG